MRSWLFAEATGRMKGVAYDREIVAIGTILHDIGLTVSVSGPNRFEVNGADAALSFIRGKGLSDRRCQLVWDLVALNSTPSLALHKEPEVAVGTMGTGTSAGGDGELDGDRLGSAVADGVGLGAGATPKPPPSAPNARIAMRRPAVATSRTTGRPIGSGLRPATRCHG